MSREERSTESEPAGVILSPFASWASWCSLIEDDRPESGYAETTVDFYRLVSMVLSSLLVSLVEPSGGSRSRATRIVVPVVECFEPVVEDAGRTIAG